MRPSIVLLILLAAASLVRAQQTVPGRRGGMKTAQQLRNDTPKPAANEFQLAKAETSKTADAAPPALSPETEKLLHDAYELAYLAQAIPPDVEKTSRGLLPKDLNLRLKRIEQLSKQLRTKISP